MRRYMARAAAALMVLCVANGVGAAIPGTDLWEPSLARTPGQNGSQWYATVWIHNPGTETAHVTVSFLVRDQSNPSPVQQTVTVDPGETLKLGDVYEDLFGLSSAIGALRFQSDRKIVVAARSYNLTAAGIADSQGQFVAGMPSEIAIGAGKKTSIPGITNPEDGSFRSNFALVETAGGTATVEVTLYNRDGTEVASKTYTLSPYEPVQVTFDSGATVDGGRWDVKVLSGSGKVLTFASMVGNGTVSQDPSTLEMEYELQQGSGSGLTQVAHDATLAGDGTSSSPLGIADGGVTSTKIADGTVQSADLANGAVTTSKISGSGAASGQVLKFNGSTVAWGDDSLTLPFGGSTDADTGIGGALTIQHTGTGVAAIYGASAEGFGVVGTSLATAGSNAAGVAGYNSTGWGVFGTDSGANIPTGSGGVAGVSSDSYGVYGESDTGTGVRGHSASGNGVEGIASAAYQSGVSGAAVSSHGYGVTGYNGSSENTGYLGAGSAAVLGESSSGSAGRFFGGGDDAVYIENSGAGRGLHVVSHNDTGVWIESTGTGFAGLDVRRAADSDLAGYFKGRVTVTGTLTAGSKSFRIDDPTDPANRYLYHTSVESPDMKNLYDGNVTTDDEGFATVTLPAWFEALNGDFRYQLTVIGGGDRWVQARIARPIEDNSFVIETSAPHTMVSWQVTGIRRDPWARMHRTPVEQPKPEELRGTYVHPKAYGQPPETGETWRTRGPGERSQD